MNPILMALSLKKLLIYGVAAFAVLTIIYITILCLTSGWKKAVFIIFSFIICFVVAMVLGYNYFYTYPVGFLDTLERNDNALNYSLECSQKIDDNTLIYITRSVEGTGNDVHIGTVSSKWPALISDFTATSTSSGYGKINTLFYNVTDDTNITYLAGYITDKNTTVVYITFHLGKDQTYEYKANVVNQMFVITDFDDYHAKFESTIEGYTEAGRTFTRYNSSFEKGSYSKTISKLSD